MVSRGSLLPLGVLHGILLLTNGSSSNQENQRFFILSKNIIYIIKYIVYLLIYQINMYQLVGVKGIPLVKVAPSPQ